MNLIVAYLSIEKSAIGAANAWEKSKYANSVDVLNVRIIMIPDHYREKSVTEKIQEYVDTLKEVN